MLGEQVKSPALEILWHKPVLAERSTVYNKWKAIGEVRNRSKVTSEDVSVIVEFYDVNGKLVGLSGYSMFDKPIARIEPGDQVQFSLEASIPSDKCVEATKIIAESKQHTMINGTIASRKMINKKNGSKTAKRRKKVKMLLKRKR